MEKITRPITTAAEQVEPATLPSAPNVVQIQANDEDRSLKGHDDEATIDEFEQLAADTILDDDDDEPGAEDEIVPTLVVKKLPKFVHFRASPQTFDLWGTTDQQGMDDLLYVTTKSFAPFLEADVELRRVRFFETVTSDGVIRLVYCFVPEKSGRNPNSWLKTKLEALMMSQSQWTTMRSRVSLQSYAYRPSRKDYGEPKFSGLTPAQYVVKLKELGMLVDSKDHPFFRKATDSE